MNLILSIKISNPKKQHHNARINLFAENPSLKMSEAVVIINNFTDKVPE